MPSYFFQISCCISSQLTPKDTSIPLSVKKKKKSVADHQSKAPQNREALVFRYWGVSIQVSSGTLVGLEKISENNDWLPTPDLPTFLKGSQKKKALSILPGIMNRERMVP